jgi:hypothetical protein
MKPDVAAGDTIDDKQNAQSTIEKKALRERG